MSNFFNDNTDLKFQFDQLELEEVVEILEHEYTYTKQYITAPGDYSEAIENYQNALETLGDLAGNFIAPRAKMVDLEGAHHQNGAVQYAQGTKEALVQLAQGGFMGVIIPHQYGGLNFPATIYFMMIEIISRADASLMTLFGYQDVGEAISKFAPEEVAEKFLPKYTLGEHTGSMVMTEPGAGSDLQAIKLKAYQDKQGQWRLKGEKQFISNGCGDVLLVLARSEPDTNNMFGLSLFACHGGDSVQVNRIENKMGLHGSPTCALYFDDAPCYLVGKRRHGLIHVLYILNHARFSVAAQALGIAEAAYREALEYAKIREQFGKTIYSIPSVANLLIDMRVTIECNRTLLYAASQWLDLRNKLEEKLVSLKESGAERTKEQARFKEAAKIVDMLSPMVKYIITEDANKICYDAQQVHGGMGYMKEMEIERLVRDVRITTIYEGTSQIQILAAVKGVLTNVLGDHFDKYEQTSYPEELQGALNKLIEIRSIFEHCRTLIINHSDKPFRELASKDLVDMYAAIYTGHMVLKQVNEDGRKNMILQRFLTEALGRAHKSKVCLMQEKFMDLDSTDEFCT
ncbi:MAG: acyl-CoA dehydrogenase [Cyclobacteriaceae bacterium]|nr:MAG: acyl-CoA dehydrogenase [Cyclobacteriaceae bacterium]